MEFCASAPGIIYTAQTSEDMKTWETHGVMLSFAWALWWLQRAGACHGRGERPVF